MSLLLCLDLLLYLSRDSQVALISKIKGLGKDSVIGDCVISPTQLIVFSLFYLTWLIYIRVSLYL